MPTGFVSRRLLLGLVLGGVGLTLSCGGGTTEGPPVVQPATVASISINTPLTSVEVGRSVQLSAVARDQAGRVLQASLVWSSTVPSVATVGSDGTVTGVSIGTTTIRVSSGSVLAAVSFPVTGPPVYVAGQSYFGRNNYIEYVAGNAPVILTAPHGGALTPSTIPDRTATACGGTATTVTDTNTGELVRAMQQQFFARHGTYPHIILSLLSRRKLDPNRLPTEAACGNTDALAALDDWHRYIDAAKTAVLRDFGKGWYMDIHGHGHTVQRLELGYLIADSDLNRSDASLDATSTYENTSSIRTLSQFSTLSFSALLRGPNSLGALYANNGFPALPSATDPSPNGADYFNGGDNTARHGCGSAATGLGGVTNGNICGVQIESNFTGVRDNAVNRDRFGVATAIVLESYLRQHWNLSVTR
ncbi:MAG: Ig-like domain-containing protein [Gemmatimonadaceae bacterium]|nr:Ig-like domain-containing protein [Gemmatimonadaceae bacterium]